MEKISEMMKEGVKPSYHRHTGSGRPPQLTDNDEQLVVENMVKGMGLRITTEMVNKHRAKHNRPNVSIWTVWKCSKAFSICRRRLSQKHHPKGELWRAASLAQAQQFQSWQRRTPKVL